MAYQILKIEAIQNMKIEDELFIIKRCSKFVVGFNGGSLNSPGCCTDM